MRLSWLESCIPQSMEQGNILRLGLSRSREHGMAIMDRCVSSGAWCLVCGVLCRVM